MSYVRVFWPVLVHKREVVSSGEADRNPICSSQGLIAKFFAPSALNIFELRCAKTGFMTYPLHCMKVLKVLHVTEEPLSIALHQFINFQTSGGGVI